MSIGPRTLSLAGCRSWKEAQQRLTEFMQEIYAASRRDMETALLIDASKGELDVDNIDAMLDQAREYWADNIGDTHAAFDQTLNRDGSGPPE